MQVETQIQRLSVVSDGRRPQQETGTSRPDVRPVSSPESVTKPAGAEAEKPGSDANPKLSDNDIQDAVQRLSDYVQSAKRDLLFSVDEDTGRTVIQVRDSETKEVVRQIPPDEILKLARHMHDATEETGGLLKLQV